MVRNLRALPDPLLQWEIFEEDAGAFIPTATPNSRTPMFGPNFGLGPDTKEGLYGLHPTGPSDCPPAETLRILNY